MKGLGVAVGLALLGALAWIYAGFFFPDPRAGRLAKLILWTARVGIPPAAFGALSLCRAVRQGRLAVSSLGYAAFGLLLLALLAYPVASCLYDGRYAPRVADSYHAYLQLAPIAYKPRDDDTRAAPIRVFCLGGSTTEFADDEGRGWPIRVEERLQGVGTRPVEVYNLGRQWYTTLHTLINFEVNLRPHKPDILVVMHAINDLLQNADFCDFSTGVFRDDYGHFCGPVSRVIRRQSFPGYLREALRSTWYRKRREVIDTAVFPGLAPFERNLRTLISLARQDGTAVVLATQPNLLKETMTPGEDAVLYMVHQEAVGPDREWSVRTAHLGMGAYNQVIRRLADEEGIDLIDLEKIVPKSLEYFSDEVHYRKPAFDLVAEQVSVHLKKMLEQGPPSTPGAQAQSDGGP